MLFKSQKTSSLLLLISAALALLILAWKLPDRQLADGVATPRRQVQQAWQSAISIGQYQYRSTILQTTHPTLRAENVGRTTRTAQFVLEGEMDGPADRMELQLTAPNRPPVEIKIEQGVGYGRLSQDDPWTQVDVAADLFAPGGDPLGYLAAMENVRIADGVGADRPVTEEIVPAALSTSIARYQFDLDGVAYARYIRAQMEEQLRRQGALPAGVSLQMTDNYAGMTGSGEIWVNSRGLPVRQMLHLRFPARNGASEWLEAVVTTEFFNWGESPASLMALDWGDPLHALGAALARVDTRQAKELSLSLAVLLLGLAFAGVRRCSLRAR